MSNTKPMPSGSADKLRRESLGDVLDKNLPTDGYVLVVHAKNGYERKSLHAWADQNNLRHCSITSDLFDKVPYYRCTICHHTYYRNQLYAYYEGDPNNSPCTLYCKECNSDTEEMTLKYIDDGANAVIIGNTLPKLSKVETRKRSRNRAFNESREVIELLYKIYDRKFKTLPLSHYDKNVYINGKEHPRVRDVNSLNGSSLYEP